MFGSEKDAKGYLESLEVIVDRIPVRSTRIDFADDRWDFNAYYDGINDPSYVITFSGLPDELKSYCKFYALDQLRARKKVSTVSGRVRTFKDVVMSIIEAKDLVSFALVTADDVLSEVAGRGNSPSSDRGAYVAVLHVARFIVKEYGLPLSLDLEAVRLLAADAARHAAEVASYHKTPDIPAEYFDAILTAAIAVMRDDSAAYNRQVTACLIVMLSQLGMRISDLLALRTGQLHVKELTRTGRTASFIRYKSRKPSRPGGPMLEFDVFSNALCTEAFEKLVSLRERCTLDGKGDFLYVLDPVSTSKDELPVPSHRFKKEYIRFIADELPEMCRRPWEGIRSRKCRPGTKDEAVIYAPQTVQYRVRVCTVLYERNVPLLYVQRYMGHLSEAMIGYYARPKDVAKESARYAASILRDIVEDDVRLLGGSNGDELKARILEQFVARGGVTVYSGPEDIAKAFDGEVTIRAKSGGVCITSQLMDCSKNKRTDALLCAYGLCPNLFHLYHMADVSYANFLVLQGTYSAALSAGRLREAEKELNKLKDLCRRRLVPELEELDREISSKGEQAVVEKHAHLLDIIRAKEEIRREVGLWMKK